jgi:flavin reductase (DIM6/NTAB) family NADH-FMN oxidoreductase RutF
MHSAKTSDNKLPVRQPVEPAALLVKIHDLFANQWLLLTAGDFAAGQFNTMTIAWGSIGTMWNKPFVQVVVRPQRHTRKFMDEFDTFTLCAFRPAHRSALQMLGTKSGRDGNKIAESGLTPVAAAVVAAPVFAEADLAIECRKIYWQDMNPAGFVNAGIAANYPAQDYHRIYFGEIAAIRATSAYQ